MRVTAESQSNTISSYLEQQSAAYALLSNQISSGYQIQAPSDNPGGYAALTQAQTSSIQYGAYTQNITDATSSLNSSVSGLSNINSVITQAQQVAIQGADASTNSQSYSALADQVNSLISELTQAANTQVGGHYIYGGTATTTPPFQTTTDAQGQVTAVTYAGSSSNAREIIGPGGQTIDTHYVGSAILQQPGADVFNALITLRNTLQNPPASQTALSTSLNTQLGTLKNAATAVQNATAEQSSSLSTLSSLQTQVSSLKLSADSQVGNIGGTDLATAIVQLQQQQTSLQASIDVSAKILQPSLLSFIQ